MKRLQNIIIGFFAVLGLIIFTTSLSSKSDSIYVPHKDGVLNTQSGMVYYYSAYRESRYSSDEKIVREFTEVDYINKSVKRDTLHHSDKNKFGKGEWFISN